MNKLIFFCLLSLMVTYTQSVECGDTSSAPAAENDCTTRTVSSNDKICSFVQGQDGGANSCVETTKPDKDKSTSTKKSASSSTNSSDILNIFKITLALLIVFTIL